MNYFNNFLHNQSIRKQLTFWFLLIALIPLAWVTFFTYQLSKAALVSQAEKHLNALGFRQIALMKNYFGEKERSAIALAEESVTDNAVEELDSTIQHFGVLSPEYVSEAKKFGNILIPRAKTLNYHNLILVAADGKVVFSHHPPLLKPGTNLYDAPKESLIFSKIFEETRDTLKPRLSPLTYFEKNSQPAIFLSTPIIEKKRFVGALIFQIDNRAIYQLIQNYQGFGKTGETLVAAKINDQLVMFSSYQDKEKLPQVYSLNSESPFGRFVLDILNDKSVASTTIDYRGKNTLVVGRHLPDANWAIISKIDQDELLSNIAELKYLSWALLLITAGIVTLMASYVARKITDPIRQLTDKTKLMAGGDLSQRIHVAYNDEIGKLGDSFNEMASQLDHIVKHLDKLVLDRTEEVQTKNNQLTDKIEELHQTQNRLITQEKLASLGALTAGIAHEIKNPLNFVKNFSELSIDIQKELDIQFQKLQGRITKEDSEEVKDLLTTLNMNLTKIHEHGKRADSIVYNMLQHSRGVPGEKTPTDINTLLDEYVTLAYHGMRAKDSAFNTKIEKNYDQSIGKVIVSPQEMSRVFLNLLNNAFYSVYQKKKQDPAFQPTVKVSTLDQGDYFLIKIWDNGLGISKDVQAKLFTPFFTTKPTGEGTGLGLSLSYNIIVQAHNGTMSVQSEDKQFAEFIIKLPKK